MQQEASSLDILATGTVSRRSSHTECEVQVYYLTDNRDSKQVKLSGKYAFEARDVRVEVGRSIYALVHVRHRCAFTD